MNDRGRWPVVAGGAIAPFRRAKDQSTWRDRAREVACAAVREAGLGLEDIDHLVVATESDLVSLQVSPAPVVASDLGIPGVAATRVEGGGASGALAVRAGVLAVLSELHRRVLVVGFDDAASRLDATGVGLVYGLSFDAEVEGMLGATAVALYALAAAELLARDRIGEAELAAVAVKNRANATLNPWAHLPMRSTIGDVLASPLISPPLKRLDCSPLSDGAAALVLAAAADLPKAIGGKRARIVASAVAGDWARLGDRPRLHRFDGKARAARQAYVQAGIHAPADEIAVAEVYDAFTSAEIQSLEALGVAPEGEVGRRLAAGAYHRDGRLPVNLSGGLLGQGGSPGAVGIAQVVTIARLLEGRYHAGLQPIRSMRYGLAEAHGGVATHNALHILEARS